MRILYLDYFTDNMNPVCRQWPVMLKHIGRVDFFGPGFVSGSVVSAGLKRYIRDHGPYDFIICAENIYLRKVIHWELDFLAKSYAKQYLLPFDIKSAIAASHKIADDFLEADANKIVTTVMLDNYNCCQQLTDFLTGFDGHVIALGLPFIRKKRNLDHIAEECFGSFVTDVWYDFVCACQHKIISVPFFVMEDEFSLVDLQARKCDWSVPGAKYAAREQARRTLLKNGIPWQPRYLNAIISLWARLKLHMPLFKIEIALINHLFRQSVESAKFSYTCGSGYQMPIRKFFEIPALRSVLVCRSCNGFEELGFKSRENAIVCEPDQLPELHRHLSDNLDEAQKIADAGQALVWRHHTSQARARQLMRALESIAQRRFGGTYWEDGELMLLPKGEYGLS